MTLARLLAVPSLLVCFAAVACTSSSSDVADDSVAASSDAIRGRVAAGSTLVTTANVNLRQGPSTSSAILELLERGTSVVAIDAEPSGAFYNVKHGSESGWVHGDYLRVAGGGGGADDSTPSGDFDGRSFSGVTLLWQGNWDFLVRCDSYSRSRGRVVFFCDESPSRAFVDDGNWIAVPRAYFSRSLCGQEARVCKGDRCVTAKVVEKSETGGKWEGSTAVMRAFGVDVGFSGCSSSFGTATGVTVTLR